MRRLKALKLMLINLFVILSINMNASIDILNTIHATDGNCNGSIEILVNGDSGPFTLTLNGGTPIESIFGNYIFENLCSGSYEILVINSLGCEIILNTTIIDCGNMINSSFIKTANPSTCTSSDGGFNILSTSALWGTYPYTYELQDAAGNVLNSTNNLPMGTYYHIATDVNGCFGIQELILVPADGPVLGLPIIDGSCPGQSTGQFAILATNPNGYTYDFNWSNGVTQVEVNVAELENLSSGTYTVTITNSLTNSCEFIEEYIIPELTSTLTLNPEILHSCYGENNGIINLNVMGGIYPYSYTWSDGHLNQLSYRLYLEEGNYSVTVTDFCGNTENYSFSNEPISDFGIVMYTGECDSRTLNPYNLTGGNTPYTYQWSNGVTSQSLLASNTGYYTLTITDSRGCTRTNSQFVQLAEYEIIGSTEPCDGMFNGTVTIDIDQPNNLYPINVLVNDIFHPVDNNGILFLDQLSPDQPYVIDITIGDCEFQEIITFEGIPLQRVYTGYENGECVYDEACNGEVINEDSYFGLPYYDFNNPPGAMWSLCYIPKRCHDADNPDPKVGKYIMGREVVKVIEYRAILTHAQFSGLYTYSYVQNIIDHLNNRNLKPCGKVKYCKSSLRIIRVKDIFDEQQAPAEYGPNGCTYIDCTWPSVDVNFCPDDIIPNYPVSGSGQSPWSPSCDLRSYNAYQIIQWEDDLVASIPDFEQTTLYTDFINVYRNNHKTVCATVTFCKTGYVLLSDNVEEQTCSEVLIPHCSNFQTDWVYGLSCELLFCPNEPIRRICEGSYNYASLHPLVPFDEGSFFNSEPPSSLATMVIQPGNGCSELVNMGTTHGEGTITPVGLVDSDNGYKFNDFSYKAERFSVEDMPNVVLYKYNIDSDEVTYIERKNSNNYSLNYLSNKNSWEEEFNSSNMEISFLTQQGDEIYVGGTFSGTMKIGKSKIVSSEANQSGFLYKLGTDGVSIQLITIPDLKKDEKLIFSETNQHIYIAGKTATTKINIGGKVYDLSKSQGVFKLGVDKKGEINLIQNVAYDSSVKLLNQLQGENNSIRILKGAGSVELDGKEILSSNKLKEERLIILSKNSNESFNYINAYDLSGIDIKKMDAVLDERGDLYLGITFEGNITFDRTTFRGSGDKDILLLKFDQQGNIVGSLVYATKESENVSKLMYDSGILYFGGEFSGYNRIRTIGSRTYTNLSECNQTAYISYVSISELSDESLNLVDNRSNDEFKETKNNKIDSRLDVKIFPNPFSKILSISIKTELAQSFQVKVYNILGEKIYEELKSTNKGITQIEINDLKNSPSGLYLVEISSEDGEIITTKQIVKD